MLPVCPWCSEFLRTNAESCPRCRSILTGPQPGVRPAREAPTASVAGAIYGLAFLFEDVNPEAEEVPGDDTDSNCDGEDDT